MKKINISTKTFPNTFCLLDDEDYEWAKYFKWTPDVRENITYVTRTIKKKSGHQRRIYLHREIMRTRFFEEVDHRNHNGLDNRRKNLKRCTKIQNQQNRIKHKKEGKSGSIYKGVFYRKRRSDGKKGRCFAYITINKKRYNLGTFDNEIEAAKEYDSKALYYFCEMAILNFPANQTMATPIK